MSCYICDNETISVIARSFIDYGEDFVDNDGFHLTTSKEIGQALLNQNYASVNFRYGEDNEAPEFNPNFKIDYNEGDVIGCIRCYSYQACETNDWDNCNILRSFHHMMINVSERLVKRCGMKIPWGYENYLE